MGIGSLIKEINVQPFLTCLPWSPLSWELVRDDDSAELALECCDPPIHFAIDSTDLQLWHSIEDASFSHYFRNTCILSEAGCKELVRASLAMLHQSHKPTNSPSEECSLILPNVCTQDHDSPRKPCEHDGEVDFRFYQY